MESLLVVTGPPGAGKSTVARTIADRAARSVLVEGDAFFGFLAAGKLAPWLAESHEQNCVVMEVSGRAAGRFATAGYETVFDGIVGPWFLSTFVASTGLTAVDWVVLLPDEDTCRARVETRDRIGFRDLEATSKMHHEFASASIDARHIIDSGPTDPERLADEIDARRVDGDLRVTS